MTRAAFRRLVSEAVDTIPDSFQQHVRNMAIVVEDEPTEELLREMDVEPGDTLFGLYQGTPLTERGWDHGNALPDRITIFQWPIEDWCGDDRDAIVTEVGETLIHELGHYFGLGEDELQEIEDRYWHQRGGDEGDDEDDDNEDEVPE
ncbi:MAG: Possibl zinc metallo-peptidase [Acidobacteria bacterium]|jgi:predicted Zn-dependent protease with MMP-like domain|nr:Possibl zinc metallo-peptidase [Acidobacteriota bacterium]